MTTTDARDIAVDTLAASKAVIDHLDTLHADYHAERDGLGYTTRETVLTRQIGEAWDKVRLGLKFAEINALVAIADRLTDLTVIAAEQKEPARLAEVARLVADYNERARA